MWVNKGLIKDIRTVSLQNSIKQYFFYMIYFATWTSYAGSIKYGYIAIVTIDIGTDVVRCLLSSKPQHSLWRHKMETFTALLALCAGNSPVTGEIPSQRPVTRRFDVFFHLRLKQSWRRWFETL